MKSRMLLLAALLACLARPVRADQGFENGDTIPGSRPAVQVCGDPAQGNLCAQPATARPIGYCSVNGGPVGGNGITQFFRCITKDCADNEFTFAFLPVSYNAASNWQRICQNLMSQCALLLNRAVARGRVPVVTVPTYMADGVKFCRLNAAGTNIQIDPVTLPGPPKPPATSMPPDRRQVCNCRGADGQLRKPQPPRCVTLGQ